MSDHTFNTDPEFLAYVRQMSPDGIGLDPCSNATSMVDATVSYSIRENGLLKTWRGFGLVFMNPPHSMSPNNIEPWMQKFREEFVERGLDRYDEDQFIGLLPSKTDTEWFHQHIPDCQARCFLRGRRVFWKNYAPTAGAGKFASLVIYYGKNPGLFTKIFQPLGLVL